MNATLLALLGLLYWTLFLPVLMEVYRFRRANGNHSVLGIKAVCRVVVFCRRLRIAEGRER